MDRSRDRPSDVLNPSQEKYDELENQLLSSRLKDEISRYGAKRVISVLMDILCKSGYI